MCIRKKTRFCRRSSRGWQRDARDRKPDSVQCVCLNVLLLTGGPAVVVKSAGQRTSLRAAKRGGGGGKRLRAREEEHHWCIVKWPSSGVRCTGREVKYMRESRERKTNTSLRVCCESRRMPLCSDCNVYAAAAAVLVVVVGRV